MNTARTAFLLTALTLLLVALGGALGGRGGMMAALVNRPLVLHEQNSVAGMANRVLALSYGEKVTEGTAKEVIDHPKVREAYLGSEEEPSC